MVFKRLIAASALLASAVFVTGCGEDIAVTASAPTPPLENIPFDAQKAEAGAELYQTHQCVVCHGDDGLTTGVVGSTAILHRVYATPAAVDFDKLAYRSVNEMPPQNKTACNFSCQENIQHYFYKMWTEKFAGASSSMPSSAQSSEAASSSTAAEPSNFQGAVDLTLATEGKGLYQLQCVSCHGDFGGNDGVDLMAGQYPIHNGRDTYSLDDIQYWVLHEFIAESMPTTEPSDCDSTCANAVSEYLRSWTYADGSFVDPMLTVTSSSAAMSSSMASSSSVPSGPTQQEINDRVAAGAALYVDADNNCSVCHGNDGTAVGISPRALTDFSGSYDEMMVIIRDGVSDTLMPACAPDGDCAMQLTDYIWVQFLGNTLTTGGGTSP